MRRSNCWLLLRGLRMRGRRLVNLLGHRVLTRSGARTLALQAYLGVVQIPDCDLMRRQRSGANALLLADGSCFVATGNASVKPLGFACLTRLACFQHDAWRCRETVRPSLSLTGFALDFLPPLPMAAS